MDEHIRKKIQKIKDIIYQNAPRKIERNELCKKVDMLPKELTYLFRRFPDQFRNITQTENKKIKFFSLDLETFENIESSLSMQDGITV